MNFVKNFNFFGVAAKEIPCITGNGAPTDSTKGAVGMFYMDETNGDVYKLTPEGWKPVGGEADSELSTESENPVQNKVVAAEIEAIKARVEELHPVYTWVNLYQYLEAFDAISSNIIAENATKYKATGGIYDVDLYMLGETALSEEEWLEPSFALEIEVDEKGGSNGNITSIQIADFPERFTLTNVSASRASVRTWIENWDEETDCWNAEIAFAFTVEFTDDEGNEYSETHGTLLRLWAGGFSGDGCLWTLEAYIPKNAETEQFFTETASTYDMRTQSIDRQLAALIEEARARREAARASTEET